MTPERIKEIEEACDRANAKSTHLQQEASLRHPLPVLTNPDPMYSHLVQCSAWVPELLAEVRRQQDRVTAERERCIAIAVSMSNNPGSSQNDFRHADFRVGWAHRAEFIESAIRTGFQPKDKP